MPSGRLGAENLQNTDAADAYTVPSDTIAVVNVNVCNRNTDAITIRLALVDGGLADLADEDYLEYDFPLAANDTIERTGVCMSAGNTIVARSDTANVSVLVYGMEDTV